MLLLFQLLLQNVCVWQKSEIAAFHAAALEHEQIKDRVTSARSSHVLTVKNCEHVSDLTSVSGGRCQQHLMKPGSAVAAAVNVDGCDKTLSQLEDELDSLLSM